MKIEYIRVTGDQECEDEQLQSKVIAYTRCEDMVR